LESSAERAGAPAQIVQIQLAVVVENDFVFQRRFDLSAGFQAYVPLSSASTSRNALTRTFSPKVTSSALSRVRERSSCTSSASFCHPDEDLRKRNVLLGVEILRQLLIAEHLVADQNSLARINSAEPAAHQAVGRAPRRFWPL
jgi:hypothetical protein